MPYELAADGVLVLHGAYVVFALLGGLLVRRRPWIAWLHLPAAAWAVAVAWGGWFCPLTPLENHFRRLAGAAGYEGSFLAHYLLPLLYPEGLTRPVQIGLGTLALLINLACYAGVARRRR